MLKKAQIGGSVNIDAEVNAGAGVKKQKSNSNDADVALNGHVQPNLQVTIPSGHARENVDIETPTSTVSSGFGTLLHSINEAMPHMTVRLPNSPREGLSGFDVTGSSDNGTVIVQKLDDAQQKAEIETLLRSGHRILAVQIPLAACRFDETIQVLNAVLPFKPEFYVRREPDWLSNLQSLGDYTGHVGMKWAADGETPKQSSSGQMSYLSTPNPEPSEEEEEEEEGVNSDDLVDPLLAPLDEHLNTFVPHKDNDPVAHDYLSAAQIAPESEPAYLSDSDEEVEFVEPTFEHEYFSAVCDAPDLNHEKKFN